MHFLGRFLSGTINVAGVIGGLAIALMMLHIVADVVGRYVFAAPLPGTIAIVANYYMVIAAFLPLAFAEEKNAHISVEIVTDLFPEVAQKHLAAWTSLVSLAVFALLTVKTWEEAVVRHGMGTAVIQGRETIPVWPASYLLPIGCGLMTAVLLYKFLVYLFRARSGLDPNRARPDDAPTLAGMEKD